MVNFALDFFFSEKLHPIDTGFIASTAEDDGSGKCDSYLYSVTPDVHVYNKLIVYQLIIWFILLLPSCNQ